MQVDQPRDSLQVPTFVKFEAAEKRMSEVEFSSRCCSSRNDQGKGNDTELGQKSWGKILQILS